MKIYKYKLTGETPSKKNSRINTRSGRSFPNKKFVQWHNAAIVELATTGAIPQEPIIDPCRVNILFYHDTDRRRDSDNAAASILDLLQDAKILHDDNWHIVRQLFIYNEKAEEAGCEIQIETI